MQEERRASIDVRLTREYGERLRRQLETANGSLMMPTLGWERFYLALELALEGQGVKLEGQTEEPKARGLWRMFREWMFD